MEAIITTAQETFARQAARFLAVITGLPDEALNWRPGPETNSLAVLVTHTWESAAMWTARAAGLPIHRDRDREFEAVAGAASLAALIRAQATRVRDAVASIDPAAFAAMRGTSDRQITVAYCLIHALEHTQEHLGQALLTRQLWEQALGQESPAENADGYRVPTAP